MWFALFLADKGTFIQVCRKMRSRKKILYLRFLSVTTAMCAAILVSHFGTLETQTASGLSFAILDLDHFKSVNDHYGHLAGDSMLSHVVEQIWAIIPSNSNVYRLGGEEFLVVVKTADEQTARGIFEKIRQQVENNPFRTAECKVAATVSIGFYICPQTNCAVQEAMALTDKYLYEAKASGRNRLMPECPSSELAAA